MIVLLTGSRKWTDYSEFDSFMNLVRLKTVPLGSNFTLLVHGACRTGADFLANEWAASKSIVVKQFPADWSLGNKAGPIRNQQMIDWANEKALQPNPDVKSSWTEVICVAFPLPDSKGTWDCVRRCERARIRTFVWGQEN